MLSHSGILNMVIGYNNKHRIGKENMLQQSAYSFDMALWQVTTAFIAGGSVFVASKDQRLDSTEIAKIVSSEKITCSMATPSEYFNWLRYGSEHMAQARQWTHAVAGGERLSHCLINEFRALQNPKLRLINIYGPSEITVGCTTTEVDYLNMPEDSDVPVPIGRAVPNYSVYVLTRI
jgi:Non-ribosomal peptide synthetase modules and related proteins